MCTLKPAPQTPWLTISLWHANRWRMKILCWPNVSLPLPPPPSDRTLVPLMDCWLSLSLTPSLHDRVNSFHSCLSLHSRPSQHPLPDSQPNGGTRPNGFQKKSEGGQGLRGAIILPYFRIYFPQFSHFFHLQVFSKKLKGRRGFTAYWFNLNVTSLNADTWIIVSYLRAWATLNVNPPNLLGSSRIDNRIHNKCFDQFKLILDVSN